MSISNLRRVHWPSDKNLKTANLALLLLIMLANGYVLLMPLLPRVEFEVKQRITKPVKVNSEDSGSINQIDRSYDHVIIPSLQLDERVYFGSNPSLVHRGVWHRPLTNTPDQGGNAVLVGHRFTYDGPAVFYSLDRMQANDEIFFVYKQKVYRYQVNGSRVVPPTASEVEAPTTDSQLTVYTCTPLITAKNRLVYTAKFMEEL